MVFQGPPSGPICAQVPLFDWLAFIGDSNWDLISGMAADPRGDLLVTGKIVGSFPIGDTTLFAPEGIFVAKFDASGRSTWSGQISDGNAHFYPGIPVADDEGNLVITGMFHGEIQLGDHLLEQQAEDDIYIIKYGSAGNLLWATQAGGRTEIRSSGIAADDQGNIFITGYYQDSATFGDTTISTYTRELAGDYYLVKYDREGNVCWARGTEDSTWSFGQDVVSLADGSVLATGYFSDSIVLGGHAIHSYEPGKTGTFLAWYDTQGNLLKACGLDGAGNKRARRIITDSEGSIYMAGDFEHSAYFGDYIHLEDWRYDNLFLAKLTPEGSPVWAVIPGAWNDSGDLNLAMDDSANIYFERTGVAKYDSTGSLLWIFREPGLETSTAVWDNAGHICIGGGYKGCVALSDTLYCSPDFFQAFLGRTNTEKQLGPDVQAPTVPAGLSAGYITDSSFKVRWDLCYDNRELAGYHIYVNDSLYANAEYSDKKITGLSPETTYAVSVSAFDVEDNESEKSVPIEVTTLPSTVDIRDNAYGDEGSDSFHVYPNPFSGVLKIICG